MHKVWMDCRQIRKVIKGFKQNSSFENASGRKYK